MTHTQLNPDTLLPALDVPITTYVTKEFSIKLNDFLTKNKHLYKGTAHFLRCALLRELARKPHEKFL